MFPILCSVFKTLLSAPPNSAPQISSLVTTPMLLQCPFALSPSEIHDFLSDFNLPLKRVSRHWVPGTTIGSHLKRLNRLRPPGILLQLLFLKCLVERLKILRFRIFPECFLRSSLICRFASQKMFSTIGTKCLDLLRCNVVTSVASD